MGKWDLSSQEIVSLSRQHDFSGKARKERGDTDQKEASSEHFPQTTQPGPGDPSRSDNEFLLPSEGFPFRFIQQTSTNLNKPLLGILTLFQVYGL